MNYTSIRIFFLCISCFCFAIQMSAQAPRTTFKGIIVDESNLPVPGATIMVLNAADSVLVQFTSSDPQGAFTLKNVPRGEYLLNITFLGLAPIFNPIEAGPAEIIELDTITMLVATKVLGEVEVKADIIPMEIKKDTISYNADAFQTQPNANVEDLLKKLPGIEVGADGTIKAQGENVQKVLVDGKEFFGDDPQMATKNLPAKSIKKVKVYDKQSDIAEFTGVDDGEREKTIDLELREEFKKGLFGTGEAGYGTDSKYNVKASVNRFTKTSQLSFLGQFNNINEQGFSYQDMMNFSGGMRGMSNQRGRGGNDMRMQSDIPISNGLSNGLVNTAAGGLNFNWTKSKKFNVRSSYFYNGVDNSLLQDVFRQNYSDDPFNTDEDTDESKENRSHNVSVSSDIKPDSMQQITLRVRAGLGNGNATSETLLQNSIPGGSIQSESHTLTDDVGDKYSLSSTLTYMKKFGNKGRNVSLSGILTKGDNNEESNLDALTQYYTTGETQLLDQLQYTNSDNTRWEGQFSYTEPLMKRKFLEFNYAFSHQDDDYKHEVSDIIESMPVLNPMLSNNYTSFFQYHKPGINFRYSGDIHTLNAALQYQISELDGHLNQNENEITKEYKHWLPRVMWRGDLGNGKSFRINYNTRVTAPTITQLSPVVDNSDPLRLYVGNPDLNAEYSHNVGANFHSFTQFSSTSFFASIGGALVKNKIINSRVIDAQFRELTLPINIDQEERINVYTSYGRPFKPIHSRFTINLNASLTKTQNLVNNELTDLNRWTRTAGLTISNMNSEVLEYNFGGTWTFTDSYYKSNDALDQNTIQHNYYVDMTLTVWKKWKLGGSFDYNLYTSNAFGEDQSLPLMKLHLSRYVLPNDRGQIKLSVFDALDENRGLTRTEDINYIEEIRTNSIARYVMLSFIYSIKGAGSEPQGGGMIRMMGPRN